MNINRIFALLLAAVMALSLVACGNNVSEQPVESEVTSDDANTPDRFISLPNTDDNTNEADAPTHTNTEFYGSFLTMKQDAADDAASEYFRVLRDYSQVEAFYDNGSQSYAYGKKFTLTMASFNDDFMATHDVLILVINEPSTYITHDAADIEISDGKAVFKVSRLFIENAALSDTYYHLVFIGEKGAFDELEELDYTVSVSETITREHNTANDAERYLYSSPDFWPFSYTTIATVTPSTEIDTITTYDELISFYEQRKDVYTLDSFKKHIGSLYDEALFDDYILLAIMVPYNSAKAAPKIDELFVYNLEIYIVVGNCSEAVVSDNTSCCLLVTAVAKSDLTGVDLSMFNISFE